MPLFLKSGGATALLLSLLLLLCIVCCFMIHTYDLLGSARGALIRGQTNCTSSLTPG